MFNGMTLYDTIINYTIPAYCEWSPVWLMSLLRFSSTRSGCFLQIHWCPLISFQSWTLLQSLSNRGCVLRSYKTTQVPSFSRDKDDYHWFMNIWATSCDRWSRLRRVCIYLICSGWFSRFDCPFCVFLCAPSSLPGCFPWSFKLKSLHLLVMPLVCAVLSCLWSCSVVFAAVRGFETRRLYRLIG